MRVVCQVSGMRRAVTVALVVVALSIWADGQTSSGLVFIHHSVGQDWLVNGLDAALLAKPYVEERNDITYQTDLDADPGRPDSLRPVPGDVTDMNDWVRWFNDYLGPVKAHTASAGTNTIIMFKSCFVWNANISSDGSEPGDPFVAVKTLANYKAVYRHPSGPGNTYSYDGYSYYALEDVFDANPDVLFIPVTIPPVCYAPDDQTTDVQAHRLRVFANWLKDEWLPAYKIRTGLNNVAVFDFFDFLAYPDNDPAHPNRLRAEYGGESGDSHPNVTADAAATAVFASGPGNFLDAAYAAFQSGGTDTVRPRVAGATAQDSTTVRILFNEAMLNNAALVDPQSYTFTVTGAGVVLTASSVARVNSTTVDVTVNEMTNRAAYTSVVSTASPADLAGNRVDPAHNTAPFSGIGIPPASPVITTNGGADFATNQAAVNLAGSCSADTVQIRVNGSLTGVTYTPGATTWAYSGTLTEGANTFSVRARDAAFNSPPMDTITVTLDTLAPAAPVITTNGGNDYTTGQALVTLNGTCSTDTALIRVNGSVTGVAHIAGQTSWSYSGTLVSGPNAFAVTAHDAAGNGSSPDIITITLSGAPLPAPVITTNGGNNYTTKQPALTLAGTCAPESAQIRVNGSTAGVTYTAGQSAWSYSGTLTEGPNSFSVTAHDGAGNPSAPDTITVTLDTIPPAAPEITTNGGNNYSTRQSSLTLNGTCAGDTAQIRVNGSTSGVAYTDGQTTWSFNGTLTQGPNTFSVRAYDGVANVSAADTITVTLDTTPPAAPVITTNGGADYATCQAALTLNGTCASDTAQIRVNGSVSGVAYTAGQTAWSYAGTMVPGANDFSVAALDSVGNASGPDTIRVTLDTVLPRVVSASAQTSTSVRVVFSEAMADNAALASPQSYTFTGGAARLQPSAAVRVDAVTVDVVVNEMTNRGSYVVAVATSGPTDLAGNCVDPAYSTAPFLGLGIPPDTPVITTNGGASYATNQPNLTLTGTCSSDTLRIRVNGSLTGVTYTSGATTWQYTGTLSDGANAFSVRASDAAYNTSGQATITVTLDTSPPSAPVITTNGGSDYATAQPALTLDGACSSESARILVNGSANGVTYTAGQTSWSYGGTLAEGPNPFVVTASDAAGNLSAPDSITVTLATTALPAPVITTNGGRDYMTNQPALTLAGTCVAETAQIRVNGSASGVAYSTGNTSWTYNGTLVEGVNSLSVTAHNAAGNPSPPDTISIKLDTIPPPVPVITTNSGNDYTTTQSALTLQGNCGKQSAEIRVNGTTVGVTYAPGSTTWSCARTLVVGPNAFSVVALDSIGNASAPDTITVTLTSSKDALATDQDANWYVDPAGDDKAGDGTAAKPWATIGCAMRSIAAMNAVAPYATPDHPVTIHLGEGIYDEPVVFARNVTLSGAGAELTVVRPSDPATAVPAVVSAAENTRLEHCTVAAPALPDDAAVLLEINGVTMVVEDVILDAGSAPNATGVVFSGVASPDSAIHNCAFRGFVGGPFVVNEDEGATVNAEYNDWGIYDAEQLAGKFLGAVDYDPWIGGAVSPADVDGSGQVDALDIQAVTNAALGLEAGYERDLNGDGETNAVDVQLALSAVLANQP